MKLNHLSIGYGSIQVQHDLCLEALPGQMICMLGTNGCGKSTLLRTLAGLQPALSGEVIIDGKPVHLMTEKEKATVFSIVLTERLSADNTTVHDVVAMGRYPYMGWLGGLTEADHALITEALTRTEMLHKRDCFFSELSDGEKQRVLIAKALAQQTPYIFLDEPTAHLDLPNRIKTLLLLRELAHTTGRTVIISTHELDLALQTADILWLMTPLSPESQTGGVAVGTPENLVANGAFERAFRDDHFTFLHDSGTLKIHIV